MVQIKKIVLFLIFFLLAGIVFSEVKNNMAGSPKNINSDSLICSADFSKNYANELINSNIITSDSINPLIINIDSIIDEGNSNSSKIIPPNRLSSAIISLNQELKKKVISALVLEENKKEQVKTIYQNQKDIYLNCKNRYEIKFLKKKISSITSELTVWSTKIDSLEKRGYDVLLMKQLLVDANNQIINPLNSALLLEDMSLIDKYCINEGCSEINFHLSAKMEYFKFSAIVQKIDSIVQKVGLDSNLSYVKQNLDLTDTAIKEVGTNAYTIESRKAVWNNLTESAVMLREIIKKLKAD